MASYKHPLNSVKIASPCTADWENMIGNDQKRFCGLCELNVYNLSNMTKREAETLINRSEGRLCVRYYKRVDGTILTRDCPEGLQAVKRRLSRIRNAVVSAVLGFLAGAGFYEVARQTAHEFEPPHRMGVMAVPEQSVKTSLPTRNPKLEVFEGRMVLPPRKAAATR